MSNKTQLQSNNETLASILSNVLGLPSQESCKHGAYVWKKYGMLSGSISVTNIGVSSTSNIQLTISSDTVHVDKLTSASFVGLSGGAFTENGHTISNMTFVSDGNGTYQYDGGEPSSFTYTYDASNNKIVLGITSMGVLTWTQDFSGNVTSVGDFIDFVVSDSPTAYPDGGEQDGYWYEKFQLDPSLFGCTKCAVDKFTFSERTQGSTVEIAHSLGEIPKISILTISSDAKTGTTGDYFFIVNDFRLGGSEATSNASAITYNSANRYLVYGTTILTRTANTIKTTVETKYYQAGVEYTLITMA